MQELVRLRMRPSRDNKSFRYMLDFIDEDGKRRQVSLGHTDKRKAQMQRRQKELELRAGISGRGPMKLSVFLEDCLRRTDGQVRPSTLRENRMVMTDFIKRVGNIDICQVQHQHGERFIRARLDKGNSPATVAKKIRHLKRLFNWLLIEANWMSTPCADSSSQSLRSARCVCSPMKNTVD